MPAEQIQLLHYVQVGGEGRLTAGRGTEKPGHGQSSANAAMCESNDDAIFAVFEVSGVAIPNGDIPGARMR